MLDSKRGTDVKNRLLDSVGEGEGGMIWENDIETCIISYMKRIIPPSASPTESKRLFYTSVSLLLSHIQGYGYHLSKFHIYALVYCIGVFLSGLLHSV